ncbi:tRNA (N(6)-L-threonylcarbamoyladenosine(37)-C(2))-methylthiotransferase MtaB [Salinispira pacifica]|uniref:MiaB family protein, possibly involved in tRNA or rRNA modification n=1 Tax=Salinispira pacifica TaxID=1307761 RepID=V5WJY5_9SPIO|nr:tRNA (N(6)-L-threonylcarbamoyladenosine(37)-C(2))-methylthiotransferase MtaB [Salinispira pacifica]AHC15970.1 MiaB family protein, possibly involved in tRNA or rRNA modification [Salinispira pacifica]
MHDVREQDVKPRKVQADTGAFTPAAPVESGSVSVDASKGDSRNTDRPTVSFNTLGCKLNQYETDALAARFMREGWEVVPFSQKADVSVVNSCTVTNKADRKTRNTINKALRLNGKTAHIDLPEAADPGDSGMVVVTGCFVDSHRDELEKDGRSFVVDNDRKNSIFELVQAHRNGEILHPESLKGDRFQYDASSRVFHTRGMVKIQDGCDNFCTFCIIPFVRGRAVSRPPEDIFSSAQQMIDDGYHELVLTGVNMSRYRHGDFVFADIIQGLLDLNGDYRLRISSIEPDQLDERFLELMNHPRMCPHLHLCLQSGSEKILLKMRRQYSYAEYREIAARLKEHRPDFNITTDIIIGFPGEGTAEFQESLDAVTSIGFGHVHAFKYSVREGTRAARMDEQVPEKEKNRRSEQLRLEAEKAKRAYRQGLVGSSQRVLVEKVSAGKDEDGNTRYRARGLGQHYVPVSFPLPPGIGKSRAKAFENRFARVETTGLDAGDDPDLLGELVYSLEDSASSSGKE